ncbi:hypothetical protein Syun_007118 [Stephania yunnanensis]|uniref:Uncharacterized protein n=1 Tax=Stephania yunnanensis TaxID=152371 RepID=A0AAP0PY85_9MAGN
MSHIISFTMNQSFFNDFSLDSICGRALIPEFGHVVFNASSTFVKYSGLKPLSHLYTPLATISTMAFMRATSSAWLHLRLEVLELSAESSCESSREHLPLPCPIFFVDAPAHC